MKTAFLGLVVLAALVPNLDATITVAVVAPVIALTAAEITGLIALKALAVGTAALVGTSIGRNLGKRSVTDERLNIVSDINPGNPEAELVSQIARNELEQCTQLLFCSVSADSSIALDKNVDSLRRIVTRIPGKYKNAHQLGKLSGSEQCVATYDCSISPENLVAVVNSL